MGACIEEGNKGISCSNDSNSASGPSSTKDKPGPFYEANAPKEKELAPRKELSDPRQFVILEGTIHGRDCQGVSGAIVEVWYAGREPTCGKMEFWPCYNAGKWATPSLVRTLRSGTEARSKQT